MSTISPVSTATATAPLGAYDAALAANSAPGTAPSSTTTADPAAYPPEYYQLLEQRFTLEAELKVLQAEQWRKIGSANVSMTLAAMFRVQEDNERDDALANGEESVAVGSGGVSSVMSTSGRAALRSAGETAALSTQKKQELASVNTQIAAIEARVNPPAAPTPVVTTP